MDPIQRCGWISLNSGIWCGVVLIESAKWKRQVHDGVPRWTIHVSVLSTVRFEWAL